MENGHALDRLTVRTGLAVRWLPQRSRALARRWKPCGLESTGRGFESHRRLRVSENLRYHRGFSCSSHHSWRLGRPCVGESCAGIWICRDCNGFGEGVGGRPQPARGVRWNPAHRQSPPSRVRRRNPNHHSACGIPLVATLASRAVGSTDTCRNSMFTSPPLTVTIA